MFESNTNPQHLNEFDDLVGDGDELPDSRSPTELTNSDDEDDETVIHKLDANSLTLKDLLQEMERRGLQPRGFFVDDAKVLQAELDKEHVCYIETKRRGRVEARALEAEHAIFCRRKVLIETQLSEERAALECDTRFVEWLRSATCAQDENHLMANITILQNCIH